MSNALLSLAAGGTDIMVELSTQPASAPATQPAQQLAQLIIIIITLGCAASIIWLIRTIINPASMSLARTPGRPNRVNPLFHILPLVLVAFLAASITVHFVAQWWGLLDLLGADPKLLSKPEKLQRELQLLPVNIISGIAMQIPLLIGSLVLAKILFDHGIARGLGLSCRHWFYDTIRGGAGLLIVYPACIGLLKLAELFITSEKHIMLQALSMDFPWKAASVMSAVILAPITEEIFFRGMIQSMFRQYLGKPWLAVVFTSALFGAAHYSLPATILPLVLLSFALGYVYERTGRLLAPIVMHMLFNGISVYVTLSSSSQ